MTCVKCNKKLADGAKFCKYCGTSVTTNEVSQALPPKEDDPRYIYSGPPLAETEPVSQCPAGPKLEQQAKKSRNSAPLIVVLCVLLVFAIGAIALVYNDNYNLVLDAIGMRQETQSEAMAEWTDPVSSMPTQATEPPSIYEFGFVDVEPEPPQTAASPDVTVSGATGVAYYKVVTALGYDLRIRSERSTDSLILGKIPDGGIIAVSQVVDGWAYAEYDGVVGWASMDYLEIVNE